jgi:hypothetical protein
MPSNIQSKMGQAHVNRKYDYMKTCRITVLAITTACTVYLFGCSPVPIVGAWQYQEVERVKSPDSQVEAVLVTGDAGATTSTATLVLIVTTGGQVATNTPLDSDAIFRADHLKGLKVFWKEEHLLVIQYDQARISSYNNLWDVLDGRQYSYPVEIRLEPTSQDFSVPPEERQPFLVK